MAEVGRVFHEPLSHENERAAFGMLSATEKEERARPNVSRVSLLSARSRLAVSMAGCKERATISSEETRCAYTQLAAQHGAACRAKVKRSDRKQSKDGFLFSFADLSLSPSLSSSFSLSLSFYPSSTSLSFFSGHFLADRRGISRLVDFRTTDELSSRFCGHSL